jgi:hypothetical protein
VFARRRWFVRWRTGVSRARAVVCPGCEAGRGRKGGCTRRRCTGRGRNERGVSGASANASAVGVGAGGERGTVGVEAAASVWGLELEGGAERR